MFLGFARGETFEGVPFSGAPLAGLLREPHRVGLIHLRLLFLFLCLFVLYVFVWVGLHSQGRPPNYPEMALGAVPLQGEFVSVLEVFEPVSCASVVVFSILNSNRLLERKVRPKVELEVVASLVVVPVLFVDLLKWRNQ